MKSLTKSNILLFDLLSKKNYLHKEAYSIIP